MEKNIKDYLHLYLGCELMGVHPSDDLPRKGYLTGIHGEYEVEIQFFNEDGFNISEEPEYNKFIEVKPILRPLSDMIEEEKYYLCSITGWPTPHDVLNNRHNKFTPEEIRYLLSKYFDLFGLIESGFAIDKTKQLAK